MEGGQWLSAADRPADDEELSAQCTMRTVVMYSILCLKSMLPVACLLVRDFLCKPSYRRETDCLVMRLPCGSKYMDLACMFCSPSTCLVCSKVASALFDSNGAVPNALDKRGEIRVETLVPEIVS